MTKMLSAVTLGKKGGWAYYRASTVSPFLSGGEIPGENPGEKHSLGGTRTCGLSLHCQVL